MAFQKALRILVILCLGALPSQTLFAQADAEDAYMPAPVISQIEAIPSASYLKPVHETADLNMLAQIFGDIARAAAGQIDLKDVVIEDLESATSPGTDSVLAAVMSVYLIAVLGVTLMLVVLLIIMMSIQSAIDGKIITQRYNEWVPLRVLYAIISMMPILGGWSIGQYGILNATFFVNSITNSMHHTANRWVYAHNSVTNVPFQASEYRKLIESIYHSELCTAVVMNYHDYTEAQLKAREEELRARISSGRLLDATSAALEREALRIGELMTTRDEVVSDHAADADKPEQVGVGGWGSTLIGALSPTSGALLQTYGGRIFTVDGTHVYVRNWGTKNSAEDSCGSIEYKLHIGLTASSEGGGVIDQGPRNKEFAQRHWEAHTKALEEVVKDIKAQVAPVRTQVLSVIASAGDDKVALKTNLKTAADADPLFAALAPYLTEHLTLEVAKWDELVAGTTSNLAQHLRKEQADQAKKTQQAYEELYQALIAQQRASNAADYQAAFSPNENAMNHPLIRNSEKGWMYAGFKWWDLSRASSFQMELRQQQPTYKHFSSGIKYFPPDIKKKLDVLLAQTTRAAGLRRAVDIGGDSEEKDSPVKLELIEKLSNDYSNDVSGAYRQYRSMLGSYITGTLSWGTFDFKSMDLLANLQQAGHKFLVAGESMLVAGGVATLTGKGVQLAGSLAEGDEDASKSGSSSSTRKAASKMLGMKGEILAGIGGLLVKVGVVFVVVGFVYAVYLPLLPAMIWTFSIIGWLEKLISLMIALPAWMAGHIIPDGDGLVNGVGRQGYVLLASIILRPPAMILSLHFAMAALGAVGFFLQDFVSLFMPSANEGYLTGIVVGIGGFIVFSGFLVVVAHLILAWIYKIPDDLPLFISGSGGQFGESQGASHLQGAAAVMVAKTEQTIAGAGGGGGPKPPGNPNLARRRTRGQGGHQGTHNRDY